MRGDETATIAREKLCEDQNGLLRGFRKLRAEESYGDEDGDFLR